MSYDGTVVTGEAVEISLPLAGVGSRGVAALIDYAITTAAMILLLLVVIHIGASSNLTPVLTEVLVVVVLVQLGYPVTMETLWHGRTVGKAAMGLRVVRDDGGPIRFRHAFVRGLVGVVLDKPGLSYGLLALIPMLTSKRAKRLGDMAAGTVVLQERVPARIEAPIAMPPPLAGWAAGLDLAAVDDALASRIRQFLVRAGQLNPDTRMAMEQQLVSEVIDRVGAPPIPAPGWAVLTAILAERRRRAFTSAVSTFPPPAYTPPPPTAPNQPAQPTYFPAPPAPSPDPPPAIDAPPNGFAPPG